MSGNGNGNATSRAPRSASSWPTTIPPSSTPSRRFLESERGFELVGRAGDGEQALQLIERD